MKMKLKTPAMQYYKEAYREFCQKWAAPFFIVFLAIFIFSRFYTFAFNFSDSLHGRVFLVSYMEKDLQKLKRGDYISFKWQGMFYPVGTNFLKVAAGLPGDVVTESDSEFFINGEFVGKAKAQRLNGEKLVSNTFRGEIPLRHFWAMGTNPHSLDSRYETAGLIGAGQIIGKAYKIW